MLTMTDQAREVIARIPKQGHLPDTAGLRISAGSPTKDTLAVAQAPHPEHGDQVVDDEGARVFVDPDVLDRLRDGLLDVRVRFDGRLEFAHVRSAD